MYEIVTQKEWNSELCNSPVLSKVKCNEYEMTNKRANVANTWIKQTSNHQGKLGGDPGMLPHAPRRPRRCQLNDSVGRVCLSGDDCNPSSKNNCVM